MTKIYSAITGKALLEHSMHCDNESLITTILLFQEHALIYPNVKVTSDWDCIAQILHTLKALGPSKPTLAHIKGHQDTETPYEELDLAAQLNCDADHLAAQYLADNSTINHRYATVFPQAACALHLWHGTLTYNHKLELQNARTYPSFKAKLCHSNTWETQDFDTIDWTAHSQALRRHEKCRAYLRQIPTRFTPPWEANSPIQPQISSKHPIVP